LVALYIGYQEYHLSEYRAEELVSSGLSSYALLRVAGTMPLDCVRSFFAPATSLWRVSPPGEVVVLVALVFLWVRKPSLRWYPGSVGLSAVLLSIVAGTVWFFPWPRLVIVFYLMSAPAVAYLLLSLTNRNRRSLMLTSVIAMSVFSLTRNMPRNETAKRYSPPGVFDLGRDMHAAEEMTGLRPKLLVETSIMNDYYGAIFMFVAMDADRLVEAEPGYFRKRSILEAKKFFSDNGIGWIVARSNDASAALCSVPLVAQSGPVKIFAYGLPPEIKSAFRPRTP
jgi:hypothetical protein